MTALVLENLAALPAYAKGLRMLLTRLARAIDALVSARAARAVPEWQMRQVRSEIARYRGTWMINSQIRHQLRISCEYISVALSMRDTRQYSSVWWASANSPGPIITVGGDPSAGVSAEASVK